MDLLCLHVLEIINEYCDTLSAKMQVSISLNLKFLCLTYFKHQRVQFCSLVIFGRIRINNPSWASLHVGFKQR